LEQEIVWQKQKSTDEPFEAKSFIYLLGALPKTTQYWSNNYSQPVFIQNSQALIAVLP
jgi:hypothetical protein